MNRNLLILSTVALLLGAYAASDWLPVLTGGAGNDAAVPAAPSQPGTSKVADVKLNPLEGLVAESFGAVLEHPVFNPGRTPRPVEPPPPPPQPVEAPPPQAPQAPAGPAAEDFALLAVAGGPSGRVAAVRLAATGEVLYLREGQPVAQWTLISIGDKSAVIGTPENNVTLNLFESNGSQPPPPAPTPENMQPPALPENMQPPTPPENMQPPGDAPPQPPDDTQAPAAGQ